jgi:alpha 1,2-mannosyltransferase
MLINTPHCLSMFVRVGAFVVFLVTCTSLLLPRSYSPVPASFEFPGFRGKNVTAKASTFSAQVVDFWHDLAYALLAAQPHCDPLQVVEEEVNSSEDSFTPLQTDKKQPERLVGFTDKHETALFRAHYAMRTSAQRLASKLPYSKGTTGIVSTANAEYMPVLLVSLKLLRRTGNKLPMEVFVDDWNEYDPTTCDIVLPSLNARCIVLSEIYNKNTDVKKPDHYQYKILSILFSSFEHVLFLDSDAFPAYDPSVLFTTAPYTTHGLVTWPDYFALTISSHFYHIAAIAAEPVTSRLSTESGQLLLNKNIHRESLLMMVYYNYYGPDYYYPLLCQGSHGAGDKETFVQAALAVGLPYYQVRTAPQVLGRWWNGTFRGPGIAQADPGLDYEYLAPMPSHMHKSNKWQTDDVAHPDAEIEKQLNQTRHVSRPPRAIFIHHNSLKLHPARVLTDTMDVTFEPDATTLHRMWGSKEEMEKMLGYDVEERVWQVVAEEACREDQNSEPCQRVRGYLTEVFGWMGSIDRPW